MRKNRINVPEAFWNALSKTPTIKCEHTVTDESIDLQFHDVIGSWWDDSTSSAVGRVLKENPGKPVNVSINSGGGFVFDGIGIYNLLVDHDGLVTTTIEGNAASIATVVAAAGEVRRIKSTGSMMIHRAYAGVIGNAGELRAESTILDMVDRQIASVYAARTGDLVEDWLDRMAGPKDSDGTWYTAESALEAGLVDEIVGQAKPKKGKKAALADPAREILAQRIQFRLRTLDIDSHPA